MTWEPKTGVFDFVREGFLKKMGLVLKCNGWEGNSLDKEEEEEHFRQRGSTYKGPVAGGTMMNKGDRERPVWLEKREKEEELEWEKAGKAHGTSQVKGGNSIPEPWKGGKARDRTSSVFGEVPSHCHVQISLYQARTSENHKSTLPIVPSSLPPKGLQL